MVYFILTAYSFGATKEKIQEIFDEHAEEQKPIPPPLCEITRENYKDYLGKAEAYTSFFHFYQKEIEMYGSVDTVRRFVWSGDMLARLIDGAYHPLIHIGYGLDFNSHMIVAEGLAMTACSDLMFSALVPNLPEPQYSSFLTYSQDQFYTENARGSLSSTVNQLSEKISTMLSISENGVSGSVDTNTTYNNNIPEFLRDNTLFFILKKIQNDSVFDIYDSKDIIKFDTLFKNMDTVTRINYYIDEWAIEDNNESIQIKLKELYTLCAVALGSTGIRKDHPETVKLDFILIHALTSSEFLYQYTGQITPSESVSLLRAHLSVILAHYISIGRPDLDITELLDYKSPIHDKNNNDDAWINVFEKSLFCKELHVIKVVRACAIAQALYGSYVTPSLNCIWLQVAEMAVDWDISGVGYYYTWVAQTED